MRTLLAIGVVNLLASSALADKPIDQQSKEKPVFVTGSLIPQRVKLKRIGTTTISPIRIIDRQEIDASGRRTTRGALITDPSVSVSGR